MESKSSDQKALLQRKIEDDTKILETKLFQIGEIPLLVERWSGDGVRGNSAVFLTSHASEMTDDALRRFLTEQAGIDLSGSTTISRNDTHTFVNFGFDAT